MFYFHGQTQLWTVPDLLLLHDVGHPASQLPSLMLQELPGDPAQLEEPFSEFCTAGMLDEGAVHLAASPSTTVPLPPGYSRPCTRHKTEVISDSQVITAVFARAIMTCHLFCLPPTHTYPPLHQRILHTMIPQDPTPYDDIIQPNLYNPASHLLAVSSLFLRVVQELVIHLAR